MAYAKKTNRRTRKGRKSIPIKNTHHRMVFQYSELTGIPVSEIMDECLSEYIECTLETQLEDLAAHTASA